MLKLDFHPPAATSCRFPGPSPVPDRILRAMSLPTIDHRGPEFGALGLKVLAGIKKIFKTEQPVVIYPASGTGAWEAALVNTLSPGDTRADVRDRPLRDALEKDGGAPRASSRSSSRAGRDGIEGLAPRRAGRA